MSRMTDLVTRLENVARKLGIELEDCLAILEGKHPTHSVVQTNSNPPTISGPAVASAGAIGQQVAGSIEDAGVDVSTQNQTASGSVVPNNED